MTKSKIITAQINISDIQQDPFFFQIPGESTNHSDILKITLEKYQSKLGQLKGNIALCDKHNILVSVVTIIYWVSTGRKDRYKGIFPKPGIAQSDIDKAVRFGKPILNALNNNDKEKCRQNRSVGPATSKS